MSRLRALALLVTLPLAACSTDLGSPGPGPDPDPDGDDGPDAGIEQPTACTTEANYPDLGAVQGGNAVVEPQDPANPAGPQLISLGVSLGGTGIIDAFFVQLWDGYGVFTNGLVPGTFTIAGPETDLNDCGACVYLLGDIDMGAGTVAQNFMASGGTITITAVDPTPGTGRLTGSLSNVQFREVAFDAMTNAQSDVPGGCTTHIDGVSFDVAVVAAQ